MKKYLIILISIIIDGIMPNITLYGLNNITYFTPVCTGISLIFLYEDNKQFYRLLLFTILLFGGLYINNLILSFIIFNSVFFIIKLFKYFFKDNYFTILIQILLVVFSWDLIFFVVSGLVINNSFIWEDYFYKVSHSIIFNVIYGTILFNLLKNSSKLKH